MAKSEHILVSICGTFRHTLLNWQFEGSLDKVKWVVLDRRVYLTSDQMANADLEAERTAIKKKGSTSTWAIDPERLPDPRIGFRYFRIVQIGKNSSGSDNLSLSGMELYGRIVSGRLP